MSKSNFSKKQSKVTLADIYKTISRQAYKYLRKHRELLENEDYLYVYEISRNKEIEHILKNNADSDKKEIGETLDYLCDLEIKYHGDKIERYKKSAVHMVHATKQIKPYLTKK